MKCCPKDKNIKKDWMEKLESESIIVSDDTVIEISNFCKVFSSPLRLKIAFLLNSGDLCVCEIVSILKEKQNLISHNLSIMKKYRVVSSYNQAKYKYYRIERVASSFLGNCLKLQTDKIIL
ncbi:MAG: winged helix-turn-helix transcriptional regulator [Candidatus Methanoperedens sp.]|nr:winged helix-turn-helix transcriptional regulator [Candidatus Methanoperedens sp.]